MPSTQYIPLGTDGIDPHNQEKRPFFIATDTVDRIGEEPKWLRDDLRDFGGVVLNEPAVIFEGLKRQQLHTECYCYSAQVAENEVFTIFVREPKSDELMGPVVMWAERRRQDSARPGFPANWKEDFGEPCYEQHRT